MNERPVPLEMIRWESDGQSTPWPERVVLTNAHRWIYVGLGDLELVKQARGYPYAPAS